MTRSIRKRQKSLRKKSANKIGHDQAESWRPKEMKRKAKEKLDCPPIRGSKCLRCGAGAEWLV